MKKTIYLTLILGTMAAAACSQSTNDAAAEKELSKAINVFTAANMGKWDDFEKRMNNLQDSAIEQRTDGLRNDPFIKAFNTFTQQNGNRYAAVRSAKFAQFGPPPPALLALKWDTLNTQSPGSMISYLELFSIGFMRTFDPSLIAQLTNAFLTTELFPDMSSREKILHYYRTRDLFGSLVYTRPVAGDIWQIWAADRSLAVSFRFDVRKGIASAVSHTKMNDPAYAQIQWPHSIVKPADETTRLMDNLTWQIWNSYPGPSFDSERYNEYKQLRNRELVKYFENNRAKYRPVREQQLRLLEQPPARLTGFKELTTAEDDILVYTDSSYYASTVLYPQQWGTVIATAATSYFEVSTAEFSRRLQRNGIFGSTSYARQLNDNEWEVWIVNTMDAASCIWDLRSGYIRKARYWIKEDGQDN